MKRIIFSNYDSIGNPYYGGGGAVAIHEVAKRLSKDFEVKVITGKYPGSKSEVIDGVNYKRIGIEKLPPQAAQLLFQVLLTFYAQKELFDIWVESFTPPFSTAFLPLFSNKPVIGLAHLLGGEDMHKKYKLPFHKVEKFGLKYHKDCIVPTESVKRKILGKNPKINVAVISNGVQEELLAEKSEPQNKHILFLSRVDINQKGLDILLRSYKKEESSINLPLVIAGSGTPKDEIWLKKEIQRLGLQEKVKLVGRVSGEEKNKLFRESAFMVLPSRYETFGMVILEAFAFGLPVVTTNLPDLAWVPDIAGDKVEVENVDQLSTAILYLQNSPEQRKIMGNAGRQFVSRYVWGEIAERYKEFINKI